MKKSKRGKGFTLIELLAIIVILAIIAVITVPIILNVIDNAKMGSIQDSAYGYKDAVNKYYVTKLSEDTTYDLTGKYTTQQLKEMGVNVSGMEPVDGWVEIEKGVVLDYGLKFDEYIVKYDEATKKPVVTKNGELFPKSYYNDGEVVYFNPVSGKKCTETDYNNNNKLGSEGCLKWYAFLDVDGEPYVNLLLNHNLQDSFWCDVFSDDYENTELHSSLGITYSDTINNKYGTSRGPVTALKNLKNKTVGWADVLTRSDNYSVNIVNDNNQSISYSIDYTGYKARLISVEEILEILGDDYQLLSGTSYKNGSVALSKSWLFNNLTADSIERKSCLDYGCDEKLVSGMYVSYWTSTASSYSKNGDRLGIHSVYYQGKITSSNGNDNVYIGIRPVITVSKDLFAD